MSKIITLHNYDDHQGLIVPSMQMRGKYKIEAVQPDGRKRPLTGWMANLITTSGKNQVAAGGYLSVCCVGSGNTTPNTSQTALTSLVGTSSTIQATSTRTQSSPPYYGTLSITYRFAAGVATGNLAEVGIGSTNTALFSRALILDSLGSPTTITVLSAEALDVTYLLETIPPTSDATGTVVINGVTYSYTIRAALVTTSQWSNADAGDKAGIYALGFSVYNGAIGAVTSNPTGSAGGATSITEDSYSVNSYAQTATAFFGLNNGNVSGGITAMSIVFGRQINRLGAFQIGVTPAIPKNGTNILTLSVGQSWA